MTILRAGWHWLADRPHQRSGLRVMQALVGCALLFKMAAYWPLIDTLWGPNGVAAGQSFTWLVGRDAGRLLDRVFQTSAGTHAVFVAIGLGAIGLVLGRKFYLSASLALAGFSLLFWRLPFSQGDDDLIRLVLAYMLLTLPPRAAARHGTLRVWLHNVGVLAIAAQIAMLYFIAGFSKASGEEWQHGTALYYSSQSALFSSALFERLMRSPWLGAIGTYVSVVYPILFPAAILSRLRVPWLMWGMCFHFLTAVFMGLWTFGTVMIGMDLFLITDGEYAAARRWLGARVFRTAHGPAARLYIDGFCPTCRSTARGLAALDWRRRLEIVSFRDPAVAIPDGIAPARLETEMTVVDLRTGQVAGGFQAVQALARYLPMLWPLGPVLAVIGRSGWGNRTYRYLAERRRIVPDARVCGLHGAACGVRGNEPAGRRREPRGASAVRP